jgi:hypothetical protein
VVDIFEPDGAGDLVLEDGFVSGKERAGVVFAFDEGVD